MGDDTISCEGFALPVRTRLLIEIREKRNRETRYIDWRWHCWSSFCSRNHWLRSQERRITGLRAMRPNRWNEYYAVHGKRHALWKYQDFMVNKMVANLIDGLYASTKTLTIIPGIGNQTTRGLWTFVHMWSSFSHTFLSAHLEQYSRSRLGYTLRSWQMMISTA